MTDRQIVQRAFQLVRADLDDDDTIGVLDSLEEAMLAALAGVDNVRRMVSRPVLFACNPDESAGARDEIVPDMRHADFYADESGYELTDPKHPTYHSRMSDLWDNREKGA